MQIPDGVTPEDFLGFFSRVQKCKTGCWQWVGAVDGDGYARFQLAGEVLAHRVAHILFAGPIPAGMVVHHLCENKACVNPEHFRLLSSHDHHKIHWDARFPERTHCKNGHPWVPENLIPRGDRAGAWKCKECHYKATRSHYDRNKERWGKGGRYRPV